MYDIGTDIQESIICHCSRTTKEKIMALIEGGFSTLDDISRNTGACSGCGGCEDSILDLLVICDR